GGGAVPGALALAAVDGLNGSVHVERLDEGQTHAGIGQGFLQGVDAADGDAHAGGLNQGQVGVLADAVHVVGLDVHGDVDGAGLKLDAAVGGFHDDAEFQVGGHGRGAPVLVVADQGDGRAALPGAHLVGAGADGGTREAV